MYEKVNPNLDFVEREKEVIDFWKKNDVFHKSIEKTEGFLFMTVLRPLTENRISDTF